LKRTTSRSFVGFRLPIPVVRAENTLVLNARLQRSWLRSVPGAQQSSRVSVQVLRGSNVASAYPDGAAQDPLHRIPDGIHYDEIVSRYGYAGEPWALPSDFGRM
jgi:hypothetical protein